MTWNIPRMLRFPALIGISLVLRIGVWLLWRHGFPWGDGLFYATIAEHFHKYGVVHDYLLLFPPGYPLLVALFRPLLPLEGSLVLVSVLFGSLIPVFVWGITKTLASERTAWTAWALTACSPLLLGLSAECLADSLFIFLITGALWAFLKACRTDKYGFYLLFSLCSGLAIQTKPEALVLVAVQCGIGLFLIRKIPLGPRVWLWVTVWGMIVLIGVPYGLFLRERAGQWMISGKVPLNLLHARAKAETDDHAQELKRVYEQAFSLDSQGNLSFLSSKDGFAGYLLEDPVRAMRVYFRNVRNGISILSPGAFPLLLAACIGAVSLGRERRWVFLVALCSPVVLILFPPFFVSLAQPSFHPGRLAGPLIPILAILAAVGLSHLPSLRFLSGDRVLLCVLASWVIGCLAYTGFETYRLDMANRGERRPLDLHRMRVHDWLEENTSPAETVASTSLLDDAFGERRTVWLPWEKDGPRLIEYLQLRGVVHVFQQQGGGTYTAGVEAPDVDPETLGLTKVGEMDAAPPITIYRVPEGSHS